MQALIFKSGRNEKARTWSDFWLCSPGFVRRLRYVPRQSRGLATACSLLCVVLACTLTVHGDQPLDSNSIIGHLDAVIAWYRDSTSKIEGVGLPTDTIYRDNAQTLAAQVVRLAFQSARAEAALAGASEKSSPVGPQTSAGGASSERNLEQLKATTSARIEADQAQVERLDKQIASAAAARRQNLTAQRDSLEGEIDLDKATLDAIDKMAAFVETYAETSAQGLEGSINKLAQSIPEVLGSGGEQKTQPKAAAPEHALSNTAGLIGEASALYQYMRTAHQIDQLENETDHVKEVAGNLRKPLRDNLMAIIQRGRDLSAQVPAGKGTPAKSNREEFETLTSQFKQLSAAVLPLSQELVVLDQSHSNLTEWRGSIVRASQDVLAELLVHVVIIVVALAVLLFLSELWRRFTFRYVHDARRRRQFLILRRFVVGFLTAVILILGFVSEFSSLATFAGFATAGVAVALQAVLLSVAAYFFLIGRYGIRVGDRISVSGVTGDVMDIGLVRMYLMELAGTGLDLYPTGRVIVLSNSVLFQASTPLFKQIPGTEFAWHEAALTLGPGGNYKATQEKMLSAVNSIYEKYREDIERQHGYVERRIDIPLKAPTPESRLQLVDAGLEVQVRYPVELRRESEVDEEVARKMLEISNEPDIKASVTGSPKIRAAVRT